MNAATSWIWTTFEVLAGDAWEVAVNARPAIGAQQAAKWLPAETRGIPFGVLAKHGFDLRRSMGMELRQHFDFTSVQGIVTAYRKAFAMEWEDTVTRELDELQAVRNLIVHRGGVADQRFIRRTRSSLNVGDRLVLTGPQVADFTREVLAVGTILISFLDGWIAEEADAAPDDVNGACSPD